MQDSVKSFTRVLSVVERNYADPVDIDKAIYDGAIPGMLHVLDPHSNFFDPKQYALFREEQEGKYYGVGMTVAPRENQTVVLAPFMASPAYKAGIRPGDIIQKVDGKTCTADHHASCRHAERRQGHHRPHFARPRRLGQAHRSDRDARRNSPPRRGIFRDGEARHRLRARLHVQ